MSINRRSVVLGSLAVGACASVPSTPENLNAPITLDQAFVGQFVGAGVFRIGLTGSERRFTARLHGHREEDRLTVVEDFFYDDGEQNRLTWVFDRAGPRRWTGRRDDTVGLAEVVETSDT